MKSLLRVAVFAVAPVICLFLGACTTFENKFTVEEKYTGAYSKLKHCAYAGAILWNGDRTDTSFTVPDEYAGYKITSLGGYYGTGAPDPFYVEYLTEEIDAVSFEPFTSEYEIIVFTVNLGKNIEKLTNCGGRVYYGRALDEGGYETLYKFAYYFNVDEENPVFYSENGKLRYRDSGKLAEEFFYE